MSLVAPFAVEGWRQRDIANAREELREAVTEICAPHSGPQDLRAWCAARIKGRDGSHLLPEFDLAANRADRALPQAVAGLTSHVAVVRHEPMSAQDQQACREYLRQSDDVERLARELAQYDHFLAVPQGTESNLAMVGAATGARVLCNRAILHFCLGEQDSAASTMLLAYDFASRLAPAVLFVGRDVSDVADVLVHQQMLDLLTALPLEATTLDRVAAAPVADFREWASDTERG
ncbi:MAG: hypothetical protein IT463_08370 [Planctomycetes bacterium]|nr:hypothetical protein [Planctomycetota bacterium]